MTRSPLAILTSLAVALFLAGCSGRNTGGIGPDMNPQEAILKELADLLRTGTGTPPGKLADLAKFESNFPKSYQAVKSGEVIVIWSVPMMGEGSAGKGEGVIVAYEKAAPDSGGWALFTNGTARKVSADEVKSASKAKK